MLYYIQGKNTIFNNFLKSIYFCINKQGFKVSVDFKLHLKERYLWKIKRLIQLLEYLGY